MARALLDTPEAEARRAAQRALYHADPAAKLRHNAHVRAMRASGRWSTAGVLRSRPPTRACRRCDAEFDHENTRALLCPECRRGPEPAPADANGRPRCSECSALLGPAYSGEPDAAGRCPACHVWHEKPRKEQDQMITCPRCNGRVHLEEVAPREFAHKCVACGREYPLSPEEAATPGVLRPQEIRPPTPTAIVSRPAEAPIVARETPLEAVDVQGALDKLIARYRRQRSEAVSERDAAEARIASADREIKALQAARTAYDRARDRKGGPPLVAVPAGADRGGQSRIVRTADSTLLARVRSWADTHDGSVVVADFRRGEGISTDPRGIGIAIGGSGEFEHVGQGVWRRADAEIAHVG